jgi:type IV pilus assembly protein PilW
MRRTYRRHAAGFSLIELMVGAVLGLLLLGAVIVVYMSVKRTFVAQDEDTGVVEGGRFAIDTITRDLRMAGLSGCASRNMPGSTVPVRNFLNSTAYPYAFGAAVGGFEGNGTAPGQLFSLTASDPAPGGTYAPALPAQIAASAIAGADALMISGSEPGARRLVDPFTSGSSIHLEAGGDFEPGDILWVTDCSQAAVFQATAVNATRTLITGSNAATFVPGNNGPISSPGPVANFRHGALVSRARSVFYFIGRPNLGATGDSCNSGGSGPPALVRANLGPGASANARVMRCDELLRGVESMQILYGVDTDGDFDVDAYRAASAVTDMGSVRALRVALLLRADGPSLPDEDAATYGLAGTTIDPVNDRRQRRVFVSTISLRNRLP